MPCPPPQPAWGLMQPLLRLPARTLLQPHPPQAKGRGCPLYWAQAQAKRACCLLLRREGQAWLAQGSQALLPLHLLLVRHHLQWVQEMLACCPPWRGLDQAWPGLVTLVQWSQPRQKLHLLLMA